jgi:GTP-eEF1A C-terminal domain-like
VGRGMPVELFSVNRSMGRIILRNEGVTIGAGWLVLKGADLGVVITSDEV